MFYCYFLIGGEVYLYKSTSKAKTNDWKADGHRWINNGITKLPRKDPKIYKTYFYLQTKEGMNKNFKKMVFQLPSDTTLSLIHYIGDESLSIPTSHGNALKQTKLFIRTKPSLLEEIEDKIEHQIPNKIYKDKVADATKIVDAPRNLKQVQNIKEKLKQKTRASRDAISNCHEIAYDMPGFVHSIQTFPDLCVVAGLDEMFSEMSEVLKSKNEQLLSYDTTFNMGDYYVSPLLFRNTKFVGNPVMLGGILINERRTQCYHEMFFQTLEQHVKHLHNIPIATDEEPAMVNAINEKTSLYRVGCHRHLVNDIKHRVDGHGGTKDDRQKYVRDVLDLLDSSSFEEFRDKYQEILLTWEANFQEYFHKSILTKVDAYGRWKVKNLLEFLTTVTTNQSEGFNSLIKGLQGWKEVPIDVILLSFRMLQRYYLNEIQRGLAGIGNYTQV